MHMPLPACSVFRVFRVGWDGGMTFLRKKKIFSPAGRECSTSLLLSRITSPKTTCCSGTKPSKPSKPCTLIVWFKHTWPTFVFLLGKRAIVFLPLMAYSLLSYRRSFVRYDSHTHTHPSPFSLYTTEPHLTQVQTFFWVCSRRTDGCSKEFFNNGADCTVPLKDFVKNNYTTFTGSHRVLLASIQLIVFRGVLHPSRQ